uniref:Uncharacterized protein n=1 Tax=Atrato Denso-like virus 1 TaxID=2689333 RepID=A0A6B9KGX0_9VIRU|nr:hypothetical protein [Atrato Denso-like virus 1]QHA33817.1 hypothetical protein [Atrato Denso-like virus 1]
MSSRQRNMLRLMSEEDIRYNKERNTQFLWMKNRFNKMQKSKITNPYYRPELRDTASVSLISDNDEDDDFNQ